MRYKKRRNNKGFLFFTLLVLASYMFVNFGQRVNLEAQEGNIGLAQEKEVSSLPEECPGCGPRIEEEIIYEESDMNVVMIPEEYTIDITDQVEEGDIAGIWDFLHCSDFSTDQLLDSTMRLCATGSTDIDMKEETLGDVLRNLIFGAQTVNVEAISDVELTLVTYPLALFLGQFVLQDSNRQPDLESPNYPSSGQVIDDNYTLKTHAPQVAAELAEELPETRREDYKVTAGVNVGGATPEEVVVGEYGVTNVDDAICDCPEEVSTSDYNPGSPNRQGYAGGGYMRQQSPGGDPYDRDVVNECLELNKDYKMMLFGNVPACFDVGGTIMGSFKGVISKVFGRSTWEDCNAEPEEVCEINNQGVEVCTWVGPDAECIDTRSIGIDISPIFGDPYECDEELCANAYLTNAYKAGLSPQQSAGKVHESYNVEDSIMFFIGTPCRANLTAGGTTRNVGVTCLWDASPYLLGYNLHKSTTAPNQEGFPSTFEIYWDLVDQAMELSAKFYGLD